MNEVLLDLIVKVWSSFTFIDLRGFEITPAKKRDCVRKKFPISQLEMKIK